MRSQRSEKFATLYHKHMLLFLGSESCWIQCAPIAMYKALMGNRMVSRDWSHSSAAEERSLKYPDDDSSLDEDGLFVSLVLDNVQTVTTMVQWQNRSGPGKEDLCKIGLSGVESINLTQNYLRLIWPQSK